MTRPLMVLTSLLSAAVPHHHSPKPADQPTPKHATAYLNAYHAVVRRLGRRAAGCSLLERRGSCHVRVTDSQVMRSLGVLRRMLAPPRVLAVATATATPVSAPVSGAVAVTGGLEACIIQHESGGNPQAVNGQYGGIGQWSPSAWAQDGGTRYASSPTGASYAQQQQVLAGEGTGGMVQQQGRWDRCAG